MVESRFPLGARALSGAIKGNQNNEFPFRARALPPCSKGNSSSKVINMKKVISLNKLYEIALKANILDEIDNNPLPLEVKIEILKEIYEALEEYLRGE